MESAMPKETKPTEERTPMEASAMARDVMKRMLQTPPTPHVEAKSRDKGKAVKRKRSAKS
jgi:hypothetical protein